MQMQMRMQMQMSTPRRYSGLRLSRVAGVPSHMATDAETRELFVSDTFNRRIQVFTLDGVYVRQFGYEGEGLGAFSQPHGMAAALGYLLVADFTGRCVHVFRPNGTAVQRRELPGRSTDVYSGPSASGAVYAVDNEHGEIHVMALNGAVEGVRRGDDSDISTKSEL